MRDDRGGPLDERAVRGGTNELYVAVGGEFAGVDRRSRGHDGAYGNVDIASTARRSSAAWFWNVELSPTTTSGRGPGVRGCVHGSVHPGSSRIAPDVARVGRHEGRGVVEGGAGEHQDAVDGEHLVE